jgi:hypothetical protein
LQFFKAFAVLLLLLPPFTHTSIDMFNYLNSIADTTLMILE